MIDATSSFYNDNLFRCYPLKFHTDKRIANNMLCAFRCQIYAGDFISFPKVYLTGIRKMSTVFSLTFSFRDKEGEKLKKRVFIPLDTEKFTEIVSEDDSLSIRFVLGEIPNNPIFIDNLELPFEPVLSVWYQGRRIESVYVINGKRKNVCKNYAYEGVNEWIASSDDHQQLGDIRGVPLLFDEGFNVSIVQRTKDLSISPSLSSGTQIVDREIIKGYSDGVFEERSNGKRYDCLELPENIFTTIAGAVGPAIRLNTGKGTLIQENPDAHEIYIYVGELSGKSC